MKQRRIIVDGHLDLAVGALQLRRDLTKTVPEIRKADTENTVTEFGTCTVTLPALRQGRVAVVCGTVMCRLDAKGSYAGTGFPTQGQCFGLGRGHAAYYEALERLGEVRIIRSLGDLDEVLSAWDDPTPQTPVGLVLTMESADPVMDPDHVGEWYDIGLRMASLSHYGTGAYAHGTGTSGGLLPGGGEMLRAFEEAGIILDLTHLTDQAFWEALESFDGLVAASHHNCRALVPGQRQLDDEMIRAIARRDGVIGTSLDLWMLDPKWQGPGPKSEKKRDSTLGAAADHIDHVCQVTGSFGHAAIGSDLDGGFGVEQSPKDLETIADLQKIGDYLQRKGYTEEQIRGVCSENWLRLLRRALKPS